MTIVSALLSVRRRFPHLARSLQDRLGIEVIGGPVRYHEDGMTTVHNADFLDQPHFRKAYTAGLSVGPMPFDIRWRMHVICWAAKQGLALEGDFVECGVNRGRYARTVVDYLNFGALRRKFWLLDTFNGLVESLITEAERARGVRSGQYEECYDAVCKTFAPFQNVRPIRGAVPGTLPQVTSDKVAFLSIDMNCVQPEIAAIEYFWPKLSSGAVIVLDDYGWRAHEEQKKGFDAFARHNGVEVLSMPTGQGVIVKP